ncbi:MAG: DNA translocase FtsK, partial [Angelakisella sp.]
MVLFLAAVPGEKAWLAIHEVLLGCFSWCAYLLGPIIIYTAVMIDLDKTNFPVAAKLISSTFLVLLLCGASQIFSKILPEGGFISLMKELFTNGVALHGGGAAGALFGIPLLLWLDFTGAAITIVVLIFVCVMIVSGGTIAGLLHGMLVRPVKQMEGVYSSAAESRAQMAADMPPPPPQPTVDPFRLPPMTFPPKSQVKSSPDMDGSKEKLMDAFMAMENPVGDSASRKAPAQMSFEENSKLFNFDAHGGKDAPPPVKPADKPVEKPREESKEPAPWLAVDDPVEYFGADALNKPEKPEKAEEHEKLPSIDEIINRAVAIEAAAEQAKSAPSTEPAEEPAAETPAVAENKPAKPVQATTTATAEEGEIQTPEYTYPPITLLKEGKKLPKGDTTKELKANADRLVDTLKSFGVQTRIVDISRGPAVTRYELQPSAGVKISRITNLADDIALNLAAAGVRIEAPIPNKAAIGIEVPNKIISIVPIREIVDSPEFSAAKSKLTV